MRMLSSRLPLLVLTLGLLYTEAASAKSPLPKGIEGLAPEQYFGVYMFGQKAGWGRNSLELGPEHIVVSVTMHVQVRAFGQEQRIEVRERRSYDRATGMLAELQGSFEHLGQKVQTRLEVRENEALLTQTIAGKRSRKTLPRPSEHVADTLGMSVLVLDHGLKVGARRKGTTFEALPPFARSVAIEHEIVRIEERVVDGIPVRLAVVRTRLLDQGMEMVSLVRPDGRVQETQMMGMMTLRDEPEAVARSRHASPDILALSLVRPEVKLTDVRGLKRLRLRVKLPEDPETFRDGHVRILRKTEDFVEIELEAARWPEEPGDAPMSPKLLEPTALIQAADPRMVARAREVIGKTRDLRGKVLALVQHAYLTIKKEYRAALSNALDVLEDPVGDCTEHSVYFVGLARAAGIPARMVVGLAYTSEAGGGFGGHAWAEVLVKGHWVAVDPTFGEDLADAAHIPLGVGNLDDITRVSNLLGRMKIRVLEQVHQ